MAKRPEESRQARKVIDTLKRLLKAKGMTYQALALEIGLSLPSVKRILSQGSLSLDRLDQICRAADIRMAELFRAVELEEKRGAQELSEEQELALARNPRAFAYFDLLIGGLRPSEIERDYALTPAASAKHLSQLERMGLIERHPRKRVVLKVSRSLRLRKNGPLHALFESKVVSAFVNADFGSDRESYRDFTLMRMSEATAREMNRRIVEALRDAAKAGELEASARIPTISVGAFVATRAWSLAEAFGMR